MFCAPVPEAFRDTWSRDISSPAAQKSGGGAGTVSEKWLQPSIRKQNDAKNEQLKERKERKRGKKGGIQGSLPFHESY